jgi:NAD-dependent dihydropyrimidine dehydrogenase PreA subunit
MANVKKWEQEDRWAKVDLGLCTAASACIDACPADVYEIADGKVNVANLGDCVECGACQGVCPANAIVGHWAWE